MFNIDTLLDPDTHLQLVGAYAINQSGRVVATAGLIIYEAALLTPISAVPELFELLLACGVLLGITVAVRSRARASRLACRPLRAGHPQLQKPLRSSRQGA